MDSAANPSGARRVLMRGWQPPSSGVTERRAINCCANSSVADMRPKSTDKLPAPQAATRRCDFGGASNAERELRERGGRLLLLLGHACVLIGGLAGVVDEPEQVVFRIRRRQCVFACHRALLQQFVQ